LSTGFSERFESLLREVRYEAEPEDDAASATLYLIAGASVSLATGGAQAGRVGAGQCFRFLGLGRFGFGFH